MQWYQYFIVEKKFFFFTIEKKNREINSIAHLWS